MELSIVSSRMKAPAQNCTFPNTLQGEALSPITVRVTESGTQNFGLWTNRLSQVFIFRCHFWTCNRSGPQVLFKNAIKIYRKNRTIFLDLFTDMQHKVLHQKPGVAHL